MFQCFIRLLCACAWIGERKKNSFFLPLKPQIEHLRKCSILHKTPEEISGKNQGLSYSIFNSMMSSYSIFVLTLLKDHVNYVRLPTFFIIKRTSTTRRNKRTLNCNWKIVCRLLHLLFQVFWSLISFNSVLYYAINNYFLLIDNYFLFVKY